MTIQASEIKFYKSAEVSDAASNGGRMSTNESVSNVAGNLFPNVPQAERLAGSTKYRKLFLKVENPNREALLNSFLFMERPTPADDFITWFIGTLTDNQGDVSTNGTTDSETHYGVGVLNTTVSSGASSLDVTVPDTGVETVFRVGDTIRITDKTGLAGSGNEETHEIDTLSFAGNVATIGLVGQLANGYNSANTAVSSGLPLGNIEGDFDSFAVTAAGSGNYSIGTNPVLVDSVGGILQTWTLTFTGANAFDLVGDTVGAAGSGVISSNFSPNNPDFNEPYFTLEAGGWSGTFQAGDTVIFGTVPAAAGIWYKRHVPVAATALAGNTARQVVLGESA